MPPSQDNADLSEQMSAAERAALGIEEGEEVSLNSLFTSDGVDIDADQLDPSDESAQVTAQSATEPEKTEEAGAAPPVTVEPVEDLEGKLKEQADLVAAARASQAQAEADLLEKYETGALTPEAYQAALTEARTTADKVVVDAARVSAKLETQQEAFEREKNASIEFYKKQWLKDVDAFASQAKANDGIDYAAGGMLKQMLGAEVTRLNQSEAAELDNASLLAKAHEAVKAQLAANGLLPKASKQPKTKQAAPPNIGSMPAAASAGSGDNARFAHLNAMAEGGKGGFEFERAAASLSEDDLIKWAFSE